MRCISIQPDAHRDAEPLHRAVHRRLVEAAAVVRLQQERLVHPAERNRAKERRLRERQRRKGKGGRKAAAWATGRLRKKRQTRDPPCPQGESRAV